MQTVHHFERESSVEESDEEDSPSKDPLPSILKPIKSSPGISPSKPAGSGPAGGGGFQSFQPKTIGEESDSYMPTGSWRTQVTPTKPKPAEEVIPKPAEEEETDGNTSALLW